MSRRYDVLVVGGGILGLTLTHYLLNKGVTRMALIDRTTVGRGASGTNAGTIAVQNKAVALGPLAQQAAHAWTLLDQEYDHQLGYHRTGGWRVGVDAHEARELAEVAREQRKRGLDVETVGGHELRTRAPFLSRRVTAANYCPTDGFGSPLSAPQVLAQGLTERGLGLYTNTRVVSLHPGSHSCRVETSCGAFTADCVVVAAGAWTTNLLAPLGISLPVELMVNQLMASQPIAPLVPAVITDVAETLTLKQASPGTVLIGGGWQGRGDFTRRKAWPVLDSMVGNATAAVRLIPQLERVTIVRSWADFDPRTRDQLPLCGYVDRGRSLAVTMSGFAGFTFGLVVSQWMAGLITGDIGQGELARYGPERKVQITADIR